MANMNIMASSTRTLIKSPPIPNPNPKLKQPSFSLPQFSIIPSPKSIRLPSLSTKSIAIAAAAASLTAAAPLPSLAAEFDKASVFNFDPYHYLSFLTAGLVFLTLELENYNRKIERAIKEFPKVKQLEEQLEAVRRKMAASSESKEKREELKQAYSILYQQLLETYDDLNDQIDSVMKELVKEEAQALAEDTKKLWEEMLAEDEEELFDDWW